MFRHLLKSVPNAILLVVGADEKQLQRPILCAVQFCGGGMVVIKAAVCGIPVIASRIYGLSDAVAEGENSMYAGLLNSTSRNEKGEN